MEKNLYELIVTKKSSVAVIGLGYVGMPLAVEFAKKVNVIGFDVNSEKVEKYLAGIDVTNEVGDEQLRFSSCKFTADESDIAAAAFKIVAVPTPITNAKTPNLEPIIKASELVGRHLNKGDIVVYESTVYPGVTEDICAKILEKQSGLACGGCCSYCCCS